MAESTDNRRLAKSASVRLRFTPTFYHHDIFGTNQPNLADSHVRITPTFESTVFNCDGYHLQAHHSRTLRTKQHLIQEPQPHIYVNQSRQRKQAFLNPCMDYRCPEEYQSVRCSDAKDRLADDINHMGGRTSRLRKCVEQMSNPIFGGFTWDIIPSQQEQPYDANQYRYSKYIPNQEHDAHQQTDVSQKFEVQQLPTKKVQEKSKQTNKIEPKQYQKHPPLNPTKPSSKSSKTHLNNLKKFKSASNLHAKSSK